MNFAHAEKQIEDLQDRVRILEEVVASLRTPRCPECNNEVHEHNYYGGYFCMECDWEGNDGSKPRSVLP